MPSTPTDIRPILERILTEALQWHPSNTGPSYTATKDALRERLFVAAGVQSRLETSDV